MSYSYHGNLSEYIKGLIESKQLLGYPYLSSAKILKHFDSYCMEHFPSETTITRDMGLRWATLKENEHQIIYHAGFHLLGSLRNICKALGLRHILSHPKFQTSKSVMFRISIQQLNWPLFLNRLTVAELVLTVKCVIWLYRCFFVSCIVAGFVHLKQDCSMFLMLIIQKERFISVNQRDTKIDWSIFLMS